MADPVAGDDPEEHAGLRNLGLIVRSPWILVAGLAVWMITHPYHSVTHDPSIALAGTEPVTSSQLLAAIATSPKPVPSIIPTAQSIPTQEPANTYADVTAQVAAAQIAAAPPVQTIPPPPPTPTAPPTLSPAQIVHQKRLAERAAQEASDRASIESPLTTAAPMVIARGSDEDECCWIRESQEASATLYSSIDSTVPNGTIRAYLDLSLEDWTHSIVVAPYGAVFAGRYLGTSTTVTGGQVRIPAEFNEIIAGNRKIKLDDEPGGDPTGTNGLGAATNRHIGAAIGSFVIQVATAALLDRGANGSQYCVGSGCSQSSSGTNSNGIGGAMQAGRQLFQGNAPPSQSLQVRSGSKITIIFQHDYRVKEWKP